MSSLKDIFAQYSSYVGALLAPLGVWAVFVIAFVDAAFMGIPMDPLVAGYVYKFPDRFWIFPLLASTGSALGCSILYFVGRKGGELLLEKRVSKRRLEEIRQSFERHPFLALMLPAMLPPPTPFKAVVLAAGVFHVRYLEFLLAILAGRIVRFYLLAFLTLWFGPQIVQAVGALFREHFALTMAALAVIVLAGILFYRLRRQPMAELAQGAPE
ncbi:MAG: YqaA family protein [Terriglobales bacterium]